MRDNVTHSRAVALRRNHQVRSGRLKSKAAAVALVGALAVGGTVAFIHTSSDTVANTFEPTSVSCAVDETVRENVKSKVSVENTGTTDAYIRAEIVANWVKLGSDGEVESVLGANLDCGADYELVLASNTRWTGEMADGFYYYTEKVTPGNFTDELIDTCSPLVAAPVDGYVLRVDVIASAIQVEGEGTGGVAPVDSWDNAKVNVTRNASGTLTVEAN